MSTDQKFDYDLVVIGGGSGGLACSKEAAKLGAKVAVFDFVKPSPQGTTWGLGGTCVNVGCIPKKLMHYASLIRMEMKDAMNFGWTFSNPKHDWSSLLANINDYIGSLNWGYKVALKSNNVTYFNNYATFIDAHTLEYEDTKTKQTKRITSDNILIATGGRPRYPNVPGAELGISSDDLFWWPTPPGKTLVVGASYIALECAGFLHELGYDTTVCVRSIFLRGFDQQCAEIIGDHMSKLGVNFLRPANPIKLEKTDDNRIKVTIHHDDTLSESTEVYDTVLWAVGRDPETKSIAADKAGILLAKSGKILVDEKEQTNVPNIFCIGDVAEGRPELTPAAIKAGVLLAQRLYGGGTKVVDYMNVPTTVFTPYEYGCCGYSYEAAVDKFGADNIETYISKFGNTEIAASHRVDKDFNDFLNPCFAKLVVDKSRNEKVIGFHIISQNAGEITQGFALALRVGATKEDFDDMIGIHPTTAEEFTGLSITGSSGESGEKAGGC